MRHWIACATWLALLLVVGPAGEAVPAGAVDTTFEAFRRHAHDRALREEIQGLARRALVATVCRGDVLTDYAVRSPLLRRPAGIFVTLVRGAEVRGCMGALEPVEATSADEIVRACVLAATEDRRHPLVRPSEVPHLEIFVSVVGPRRPVEHMAALAPLRLGLLVQAQGRAAVLLPGEALSPGFQLAECRRKAGIPPQVPVTMQVFPTVVFGPAGKGKNSRPR